ncbi:hypothetical protein [Nocardia sp. CS682]|uniref:hypothetical protein n=1 Tax=Nocardia sp. CS682 TaxID=1047172 RepID=UPI0010757083|nr:hypothetical protein [Nocardia sp. CS682]
MVVETARHHHTSQRLPVANAISVVSLEVCINPPFTFPAAYQAVAPTFAGIDLFVKPVGVQWCLEPAGAVAMSLVASDK